MRTDDGYIIHKCLNGEPESFGVLVDKYKEGIYAYTYTKLQDWQDAQDVTQETFIQAYRKLHTLKRWDSFAGWLYRIASNFCKNWKSSKSKRPDRDFIEDQKPAMIDKPSIDYYRENEMVESVHEALNSLSETYREVLTLYYFGGMDSNKIAEVLNTSPLAIRIRLSRARAHLKEEIFNMMSVTFEQQKLKSGFTFRIVEAIKRIKIHPTSQMKGIPWGVSLAFGMIMAVIGLNPQLFTLETLNPRIDFSLAGESKVLDVGEIPVSVLKTSKIPLMSAQNGNNNGVNPNNMNTFLMAPQAVIGEWEKKTDMPTAKNVILSVVNGKMYLIGGSPNLMNTTDEVEEYDPSTNKWSKKASMSKLRGMHASCVVDGKIYVFGGASNRGADWKAYSDVIEYDPSTDKWTQKSDMPAPLAYHCACEYNGKVYVFGGMPDGISDSGAIYIYDPKIDTWGRGKDLPRRRTSFAAGVLNGKIYAIGGTNPGYVKPVDEYDIATDTWSTKTEFRTPGGYVSCTVVGDKIYVMGGEKDFVPRATMEIYDPIANTWEDAPPMKNARGALATCLIDGKIYVIGGSDAFGQSISAIEVFDTGYSPKSSSVNSKGKIPTTWGEKKK